MQKNPQKPKKANKLKTRNLSMTWKSLLSNPMSNQIGWSRNTSTIKQPSATEIMNITKEIMIYQEMNDRELYINNLVELNDTKRET